MSQLVVMERPTDDVALRVAGSILPPRLSAQWSISIAAGGDSISATADAEER
jgi:hypothetical protein